MLVGVRVGVGCPGGVVGRRVGARVPRGVGDDPGVPWVDRAVEVMVAVVVEVPVGVQVTKPSGVGLAGVGDKWGDGVRVISGKRVSPGRGVTVGTGVSRPVCRVARISPGVALNPRPGAAAVWR